MELPWRRRPARAARDTDLDDEIRTHLAMAVAERIARGESPENAAAAARREFGNVGQVKEATREMWGGVWVEQVGQDVRYALRTLRRAPGFAAAAILTFALGIGVNTAMLTVVEGVLLRPLPFHDPSALFIVSHSPAGGMLAREPGMFDRQYVAYRETARAFETTAMYNVFSATLTGAGDPERVTTTAVTAGFLRVLGVAPALGHAFTDAEERGTSGQVVIISDALWRDRFSTDRGAIGRSVKVDGEQRTIVGVMPRSFDFPSGTKAWFPTQIHYDPRRVALRPVIGRLASGATPRQALRELEGFVQATERDRPGERIEHAVTEIIPLKQRIVGNVQHALLLFAGAVGFVLLIACANVANLLLMRATSRQHEITIRAAIGAERSRLIRQLLTESLVLAAVGGLLGVAVAAVGVRALLTFAPAELLPRAGEIHLNAVVLGATTLVCAIAGLGFGVIPALHVTRREARLAPSGGRTTAGARRVRMRNALVTAECALAVVLLVGAGLLIRSFERLRAVDLGFRPDNIVTFMVDLPADRYATAGSLHEFRARTMDALARVPGVTAVAAVNWRPLSDNATMGDFQLADGRALPPGYVVLKPAVTPDYFRVMGIRLRQGRTFENQDDGNAPGVVIVSRLVAQQFWPDGDAIGRRIAMVDKPAAGDWLTVVGVVDDIVQFSIRERIVPAIYLPLPQVTRRGWLDHLSFAARLEGDPAVVEREVRGVLHAVDPLQPVESITTMQGVVSMVVAEPLFQTRLLGLFAMLALVLAAVGIYGVLAYAIAERTHEIGVRLALGATANGVKWLVVRRTLALAAPGIVLGLIGAGAATRLMSKLLFEVSPTDPATFVATAIGLAGVALAACVIPARRAARLDPLTALRVE